MLASIWLGFPAPARADDAVAVELNRPATITPRAKAGLFTSIANAGSRLVAVGEQGRILLSDDNGLFWRQVATPTSVTLTKVRFATSQEGWAVGQMGIVLHTKDGGLTWQKQFDDIAAGKIMLSAAQAAVAAGSNATTQANLQAAQIMVGGGPNVPFLTVLPLSPTNVLIAGGFGIAFSSSDGGATWQSIAADIPNPNGLHIYDLVEDQTSLVGVGEQGFLLLGCLNGVFANPAPPSPGSFFGALLASDHSVIIFGLQGAIFRSNDKGSDWTKSASHVGAGIDCGVVLRNGDVVLGDIAGDLLISHNSGATFSLSSANQPVVALAQANDGTIILGGPAGLSRITSAAIDSGV